MSSIEPDHRERDAILERLANKPWSIIIKYILLYRTTRRTSAIPVRFATVGAGLVSVSLVIVELMRQHWLG
jgi:hypothetical protein